MWADSYDNLRIVTGPVIKADDILCVANISSDKVIIEGEGITLTQKLNKKKKRKKITVFISG